MGNSVGADNSSRRNEPWSGFCRNVYNSWSEHAYTSDGDSFFDAGFFTRFCYFSFTSEFRRISSFSEVNSEGVFGAYLAVNSVLGNYEVRRTDGFDQV